MESTACNCNSYDEQILKYEEKLDEAKEKVTEYKNKYFSQTYLSEQFENAANAVWDAYPGIRLSVQASVPAGYVGSCASYLMAANAELTLVAAVSLAGVLITEFVGFAAMYATSKIAEIYYKDQWDDWEKTKEEYFDKLSEAKDLKQECLANMVECDSCGEHFRKDKPECIKKCKGCGNYYCNSCFDENLEYFEMK